MDGRKVPEYSRLTYYILILVEKDNKKYEKSFPQESSIYYNFLVDKFPNLSN